MKTDTESGKGSAGRSTTGHGIGGSLSAILAIVAAFIVLHVYIERRVDSKMDDPVFLRKIASHVSPSIVFDSNGSILADMGGMQYIEDIHVTSGGIVPEKVVVTPKSHMAHAPIIYTIDPISVLITAKRGTLLDWVYTFQLSESLTPMQPARFRLEIIP